MELFLLSKDECGRAVNGLEMSPEGDHLFGLAEVENQPDGAAVRKLLALFRK